MAKEPEHRGEHGVAVKTIAWGMPGDSGVTCMLVCALPLPLHTRPGRIGRPAFPAPSIQRGREINEYLAQKTMRRDREAAFARGGMFEN